MNVTGKNIAIIGYGVVGKAAAKYVITLGGSVVIFDRSQYTDLKKEDQKFIEENQAEFRGGLEEADDLTLFDAIISSPGISRYRSDLAHAESAGVPLYTDITLFLECWNGNGGVIGVTGSNGKSTVVSLFETALKAEEKPVLIGGNIGNSPLEWLTDPDVSTDATVVLELSSYMLEYFNKNHVLDISVIISFSQNHLSRHGTLKEYARTKTAGIIPEITKVYLGETEGVQAFIAPLILDTHPVYVNSEKARELITDSEEIVMLGSHNLLNIGLVAQVLKDLNLFGSRAEQALKKYPGLAHRIELIIEKNTVRWINDSKSTSPDATIKALEAVKKLEGKIILITGGVDKGVTYESWRQYFDPSVMRCVVLLPGPADQEIIQIAQEQGVEVTSFGEEKNTQILMQKIVAHCEQKSKPGDTILLSPGAASLNLWNGFEARGRDFVEGIKKML